MTNEALESEIGEVTSLKIPLNLYNSMTLNQVFNQKGKKRQLIEESISFGKNKINNPLALSHLRVYLRRFSQNKLNALHLSDIFEQSEITEVDKKGNKHLKRTLLVKGSEPKIYIDDVEVETMLDTMRDAMQGYNRAKLFEQYTVARINEINTQIFNVEGGKLVMENIVLNPMSNKAQELIEHIKSNPFDENEIRSILKGNDKK